MIPKVSALYDAGVYLFVKQKNNQALYLIITMPIGLLHKRDYYFLSLKENNNRTSSQQCCYEKPALVSKKY